MSLHPFIFVSCSLTIVEVGRHTFPLKKSFYFILFYFILFYLILSYFILFYFILFYLSYVILFYFIYFILFYFISFYFICLIYFIKSSNKKIMEPKIGKIKCLSVALLSSAYPHLSYFLLLNIMFTLSNIGAGNL